TEGGGSPQSRRQEPDSTRESSSVVEAQQATETFAATDRTIEQLGTRFGLDQLVAEGLVVPLLVVVGDERGQGLVQHALAEQDEAVEALGLDGKYESLREGIHVWRPARGLQHVHARGVQDAPEECVELAVAVDDEEPLATKEPIDVVGQVAG